MIRRYFLLQILLGWLLAITAKFGFSQRKIKSSNQTSSTNINSQKVITFFVATNGNDTWSGKLATPNADNSDGPFATWKKAQQAVRKVKSTSLHQPIKVIFNGGTYYLNEPIIFTPEDSGTSSSPVVYKAASQQVTISGGRLVEGWQEKQLNGLRLWTVDLSAKPGLNFQHLWVNGKRRVRSRYPTQGYLKVKSVSYRSEQAWHQGDRSFTYHWADIPQDITVQGAEAVVMNRWVESRLPIARIDRQAKALYFDKESVFQLASDDLYYLENHWEFLDTPGEWYFDSKQSRLYYLPLDTENIATTEVVIPLLDVLTIFKGTKENSISHLKFKNLTFAHTDWHLPPDLSGYSQNAWGVPGAIVANDINNCRWYGCTFKHLGGYGIELFRGCRDNQIVDCSFYDLGAGGIKIGERQVYRPNIPKDKESHHNIITSNHIYSGGKFFHSGVGIGIASSHHNAIAYNHIHDFYYTAIAVIGDWGFERTQAYKNIVERNYIHHIGRLSNGGGAILSDMGGIYSVGNQPGTIFRHNKIHNIYGLNYGGWGIYLDEGSFKVLVEDNLVYKTSHGGFSQHYGRENVIQNNIFAFGKSAQIHRNQRDREIAIKKNFISFYFRYNIVYWQEGEFIAGLQSNYRANAVFEHNIYWKVDEPDVFGDLTQDEWRKSDRDSRIVDPLFVAPRQGNFKLQPNSPALGLGIEKISN